jgi:hypothetical protein
MTRVGPMRPMRLCQGSSMELGLAIGKSDPLGHVPLWCSGHRRGQPETFQTLGDELDSNQILLCRHVG